MADNNLHEFCNLHELCYHIFISSSCSNTNKWSMWLASNMTPRSWNALPIKTAVKSYHHFFHQPIIIIQSCNGMTASPRYTANRLNLQWGSRCSHFSIRGSLIFYLCVWAFLLSPHLSPCKLVITPVTLFQRWIPNNLHVWYEVLWFVKG